MGTHFHFLLRANKLKINWHCLPCTFSTETLTQYPSEGKLQLTWKFYISLSLSLSKWSWQPPRYKIQSYYSLRLIAKLKKSLTYSFNFAESIFSFNEIWEFSWLPRVCVISYWKGQNSVIWITKNKIYCVILVKYWYWKFDISNPIQIFWKPYLYITSSFSSLCCGISVVR